MEAVYTENHKGYTIEVYQDESAEDPIKTWDMLGTFVCFHGRYDLGNTEEFKTPQDFEEFVKEQGSDLILIPLYMYDHSGIGLSTSNVQYPFNCPWDSGQLGWVYVTKQKLRNWYSWKYITKKRGQKAIDLLINEVTLYDNYLRGNVHGYNVEDSKGNLIDSCWGFYGDIEVDLLPQARLEVSHEVNGRKQKHWRYLKGIFRNKVALQYRRAFEVC